jgi:hypothetical protein
MIKSHTLTMSPDYVGDWGFWQACREILQNSIDQCRESFQSDMVFDYDVDRKQLRIGATKCRITPKTLLLGNTTKRGNRDRLGEHGEGYKLAMLVLLRNSYSVEISNGSEVWLPRLEHSPEFDEHVLRVDRVSANGNEFDGVVFTIRDVNQDKFGEVCANYLPGHDGDRILEEDFQRGRIFVGGLFVCDVKGLSYGYDFRPGRLKMDRDRQLLDSFDVMRKSAALWSEIGDTSRLYKETVERETKDTELVWGYLDADQQQHFTDRFVKDNPGKTPVACTKDAEHYKCGPLVIVNSQLAALLHRMKKFVTYQPEGAPSVQLEAFAEKYRWHLGEQGRRDLDDLIKASVNWTAP